MNKTCKEEIKNIRIEYDNKINNLIKRLEEEKAEYRIEYEKKNPFCSEILDFQKCYLKEMKTIQNNFENYIVMTNEKINLLNKKNNEMYESIIYYKSYCEELEEKLKNYKFKIFNLDTCKCNEVKITQEKSFNEIESDIIYKIDLENAHERIKEMQETLNHMNKENESLSTKLNKALLSLNVQEKKNFSIINSPAIQNIKVNYNDIPCKSKNLKINSEELFLELPLQIKNSHI